MGETVRGNFYRKPLDVEQVADSGFVITGSTFSTDNGYSDNFIFKTDADGNLLWTRSFGYLYDNDEMRSVYPTSDGGFFLTGYATGFVGFPSPDVYVIRTDGQGESCGEIPLAFTSDTIGMAVANEFALTISQCFISTPSTIIGNGANVTTLCSATSVKSGGIHNEKFSLSQNYPNPFNPSTTIRFSLPKESYTTLEIFNILGEKVGILVADILKAGTYEYHWNGEGLSSGIYFYKMETVNYSQIRKMILVK